MALLRVTVLGGFSLAIDDAPITAILSPRLQSLLAFLILRRGAPVSRQALAFALWPDSTEPQARTNLRKALLHLRREAPALADHISMDGQTAQWRETHGSSQCALDVAKFEAAVAAGQWEQAVALYAGDLLPDCGDEWIAPERDRLNRAFAQALAQLVAGLEIRRDYPAAIHYAERLLRLDPFDENTCAMLMRLRAMNGDRAGALRVYRNFVAALRRDLETVPAAGTYELYERLLRADEQAAEQAPLAAPLVGRVEEWQRLRAAWQATGDGPQCALITGDAGIGKTRLAEELVEWAGRQGIATAAARCYAAEGALAYAPVSAWLRSIALRDGVRALDPVWQTEVARLLPELLAERPDLPKPGPLAEGWQRKRFFESLARAILNAGAPLLLWLDDLQWADRETLEWLRFLLRFDPRESRGLRGSRGSRLLLVGTVRSEEVTADHPLNDFVLAMRRDGSLAEIDLGPLSASETAALARQITGHPLSPEQAGALYHETEGNPLFVVETLQASGRDRALGVGESSVDASQGPIPQPLIPTIQAVLDRRLNQLTADTRALAGLAATVGREFALGVLAAAGDRTEEVLASDLEELLQRRIVRERAASNGQGMYDFSHDKLRDAAYRGLSAVRRNLLHRRVAEAMERLQAANPDAVAGQIAAHFERAGLPLRALAYYARAAEAARNVYANAEAIRYYRRAEELLAHQPFGQVTSQAPGVTLRGVREALGDVLHLTGQHEEAQAAYERAMSPAPASAAGPDAITSARLQRKIANTFVSRREFDLAAQAYARADAALSAEKMDDAGWRQEWLQVQIDHAMLNYWRNRPDEIDRLVARMRPAVERFGMPAVRAGFYMLLLLRDLRVSRYRPTDQTLDYAREFVSAQRHVDDPSALAFAVFDSGFSLLWHGDLDQAEEQLREALAMAERIGDVTVRTRCLNYLAVLYRFRGDVEQVRAFARLTLDSAAVAGMPEYTAQARGNEAWVAWKQGRFDDAVAIGQDALRIMGGTPAGHASNTFVWGTLLPLLAVALRRGGLAAAADCARRVLDLAVQRLPDDLTTALEEAVRAFDDGRADVSRAWLEQSVALAQQTRLL
jgi:DNA-binding SARP family transcriptional activator